MEKITEIKIGHETAILAKAKGFDIGSESSDSYTDEGTLTWASFLNYNEICYAPTQALLEAWLRSKGVHINVVYDGADYLVSKLSTTPSDDYIHYHYSRVDTNKYTTYEEALEVGLQAGLKLVKLWKK